MEDALPVPGRFPFAIDPSAIDIDPLDYEIYWVDFATNDIRKAPAKGGNPVLVFDPIPGFSAAAIAESGKGVALDRGNHRLFTSGNSGLESGALSSPPNTSVQQAPFIFSGADSLEVDEAAGWLSVAHPNGARILRCPVSNCDEVSDLVEVVTSQVGIGGIAILSANEVPVPVVSVLGPLALVGILCAATAWQLQRLRSA